MNPILTRSFVSSFVDGVQGSTSHEYTNVLLTLFRLFLSSFAAGA